MKTFEELKEGDKLFYFDPKGINLEVYKVTGTEQKGGKFAIRYIKDEQLVYTAIAAEEKVLCYKSLGAGRVFVTDFDLLCSLFSNIKDDISKALDKLYDKVQDF